MQVFVRADQSSKIKERQELVADQWKKMENIYEASAREIAPRYQKLMNCEPVADANESDSEDEDGDT